MGGERLRRVCTQQYAQPAAQIVAAWGDEVLTVVGVQPLADDCTTVIVKQV
jgi:hypothetical protein